MRSSPKLVYNASKHRRIVEFIIPEISPIPADIPAKITMKGASLSDLIFVVPIGVLLTSLK
jgi:hypothetical protein